MLELDASKFVDLVTEVRRLKTVIENFTEEMKVEAVAEEVRDILQLRFAELGSTCVYVGAAIAAMAANRMQAKLADPINRVVVSEIRNCIDDVESRLRDELQLVTFFVLNQNQKGLLAPANSLVHWDILRIFPDAARELEEAAKCLALRRPTASVFHTMRMLEVGIRRLATILEIPDPTKPAERNWGTILKKIKDKIDEQYPPNSRLPDTDGAVFEKMYASLDAVKNPWRNGTMHVESFYTESEAYHITNCVVFFMQILGSYCEPGAVNASNPVDVSAVSAP